MNIEKLRNRAWTKANDLINIIYSNSEFDFDSKLKIVMYRIKTEDSILKRLNEGKYPDNYIYDLLGIRYVLNNREDCYELLDSIKKIKDIKIQEIKNYIENPRTKTSKYKAIHIRMQYKGTPVEIQIMDIPMFKYTELTHDAYKKGLL